jgi:lipopolysaccharide/colanic/teichoic acid biosynthesis glycosyltransferase
MIAWDSLPLGKAVMNRLFDIMVSAVGLGLLAIPFLFIALAIKLTSPGPVIYRQRRVGRYGRVFWLYKLRTMDQRPGGPEITMEQDPRVTPIGRVLRRWKIDELPQLWNVLRGDMSVIGPRPEVERFVRYYNAEQRRVLEQTPGLAGLSQLVYPHEAELLQAYPHNVEEVYVRYLLPKKVAVDLEYGKVRTFWSDLRLLSELALLIAGKSYRSDRTLCIPSQEEWKATKANGAASIY